MATSGHFLWTPTSLGSQGRKHAKKLKRRIDTDHSLLYAGETLSAQHVPCVLPERFVKSVLCLGYHHASQHKSHLPLNCTFTGFMLTLARGPLCLARSSACRWQKSLGSL